MQVSDSTLVVWIPVSVASREWTLSGESWCEDTCVIRLGDIHGSPYEIHVCVANKAGFNGTFEGLARNASVSLVRVDPIADDMDEVTRLFQTTANQDGLRITLLELPWVESVIGARPDSVQIRLDFGFLWQDESGRLHEDATNRWDRRIAVTYRVNPETAKRERLNYRNREEEVVNERNRLFEPRQVRHIWIAFATDSLVELRHSNGSAVTENEVTEAAGPRLLPFLTTTKTTSFALHGRTLFYTNVSLFEANLATGTVETLYAGFEAHYGRYYHDIAISPTGRFLAVCWSNGTGSAFLYDLDLRRAVWKLGDAPAVWSADGTTLSNYGRHLRVEPKFEWLDGLLRDTGMVLDGDDVYSIDKDGVIRESAKPTDGLPSIIALFPTRDEYEIVGFVGEDVVIHAMRTGKVFICGAGPYLEIVPHDMPSNARVSIQYVFDTP